MSIVKLTSIFFLSILTSEDGPDNSIQNFNNKVESSNVVCGFARSGRVMYLKNSDANKAYMVTVRKKWRTTAGQGGQSDEVIQNAAGARVSLGCSKSDIQPVTTFTWEVVGETEIEK